MEKQAIKLDGRTKKWFNSHPGSQTTVMQCPDCGLFYKPMLGHECKKRREKKEV